MSGKHVVAKRPSGGRITVWVAIVFSGLLAFVNASIATSDGMRVFLIACGIVILTIFVVIVVRWYFEQRDPADSNGDQ